jgi:hypothetical protein
MILGQYPNLNNSVNVKSLKLGPNTKLTLYSSPNFQGTSNVFLGNSDAVNNDAECINFTFSSCKIEKYPDALPSKPSNLTNTQLDNLWVQAGCKSESIGFNSENITNWKSKNTVNDVISAMNMKNLNSSAQQECITLMSKPNVPNEGEVVLFENCNYEGKYKKFVMGNISSVGDFDNLTSSIKIGPFTSVDIFSDINFSGKSTNWKNDSNTIVSISCLTANNFDNELSSLKINSSSAQVNFNLDIKTNPVFVAGPWNTNTWGLVKFVDTTSNWIWHTTNSAQSAPVDTTPIRFQLLIPITGNKVIPITIHVIADNAPQGANFVKVNNKLVGQIIDNGWLTSNYSQINSVLSPGNNLLEFDVQNIGGSAGLLVSVINSNTNEVIANSNGTGQWGWVDPSKILNTVLSQELDHDMLIHDEQIKGKIVKFKDNNQLLQTIVNSTFRLSVNLTIPPYIKGRQYKPNEMNQFYLSVEKLDPNCQIDTNNKCMNMYVDNKKCSNASLSNVSRTNAYRLVLISKTYALDPAVPFGKNVDFTIIKLGDKMYLKNIQTGYMPTLFTNNYLQSLYGYMDVNYLSNYPTLKSNENKLCGSNAVPVVTPTKTVAPEPTTNIFSKAYNGLIGKTVEQPTVNTNSKFVTCDVNADGSIYFLTTKDLTQSNPIKFIVNKDGTVSIRLQQYNSYGIPDKSFSLISCNYDVNTYAFIEKMTNNLGTFLVNMLCVDPVEGGKLAKNTLNFSVEVSKFSDSYLKEKNIFNLNE